MLKRFIAKVKVRSVPSKKRSVVNAYNEECFWVHNGPVLSNLKDLVRALSCMNDEQFRHHVTLEKNDFALWVGEILEDDECAAELERAKTVKTAARAVERRLRDYYL